MKETNQPPKQEAEGRPAKIANEWYPKTPQVISRRAVQCRDRCPLSSFMILEKTTQGKFEERKEEDEEARGFCRQPAGRTDHVTCVVVRKEQTDGVGR